MPWMPVSFASGTASFGAGSPQGDSGGLKDAGYYALDALRIEAGRRAWGAELGPDETPFEAGLGRTVRLDKAADFIGKVALQRARAEPLRKKLVSVVFADAEAYGWGGEALLLGGRPVGELASVGWSWKAGTCIGLAYLRGAAALEVHAGTSLEVELWGERIPAAAWDV